MAEHEFAVRYREKGADGYVSEGFDYAEWSCGCPRIYSTFAEADETARNWRADVAEGVCDYMTDIEVVRRPAAWEPLPDQPATCTHPEVVSEVVRYIGIRNDSEGAHDYEEIRQIIACNNCGTFLEQRDIERPPT